MPKGKPNSKYDWNNDNCQHEDNGWCSLPKGKRCADRLPINKKHGGGAACQVVI